VPCGFAGLFALNVRHPDLGKQSNCFGELRIENHESEKRLPQSVITSKAPPDFINPFIERVKSGMKAFVVKVEYIANHYQPKKPVMTL
jgi:hypothetical protein